MTLRELKSSQLVPVILIASSVLVGIAIALDGPVSRGLNGVAGIGWFLSAVMLSRSILRDSHGRKVMAVAAIVGLILVIKVKPSDLLWAAIGFTIGGAIVALTATRHRLRAALLLPALWLPIHLLVAISRVIERAIRDQPATVRTDPPPTAAVVPIVMVVAALAGGFVAQQFVNSRAQRLSEPPPVS